MVTMNQKTKLLSIVIVKNVLTNSHTSSRVHTFSKAMWKAIRNKTKENEIFVSLTTISTQPINGLRIFCFVYSDVAMVQTYM